MYITIEYYTTLLHIEFILYSLNNFKFIKHELHYFLLIILFKLFNIITFINRYYWE